LYLFNDDDDDDDYGNVRHLKNLYEARRAKEIKPGIVTLLFCERVELDVWATSGQEWGAVDVVWV
jgi:hypothetical protein